jgi:hypothetical protein
MRLLTSGFAVFIILFAGAVVQGQSYTEDALVQYAKSIDVSKLDSTLPSQPLAQWLLRGPARIEVLSWRVSLDCDLKDPEPDAEGDLPLCVKIGFRRGNVTGFGLLTVGSRKSGIKGRPVLQYLAVLSPPSVGNYDKLSEFPRYLDGIVSIGNEQTSCVVEDMDTPTMPACVVQSRNGVLLIPEKYWMHPAFNRYGLSAFTIESFGRVYINRSGRVVIRDVGLMDNGPDEFHHGLVRVNRDGKWGYADPSGTIVVAVKYSCAINSENIGPLVCVECHIEHQGEYQACLGGRWFRADTRGHLAPSHAP